MDVKQSPSRVKISLLSKGIDFGLDLFAGHGRDFYANQYVYGRTSKDVTMTHRLPQALNLGNGVISAVLRRTGSPWSLRLSGDVLQLTCAGEYVQDAVLPERPAYFGKQLSDGTPTENFIAVAGEVVPGFFLYPECHYFPAGVPCAFCSLRHTRKTAGRHMESDFRLEKVVEAVRIFQQTKWKDIPIVSITTGTFPDNDEGARYTSRIIRAMYDTLDPKIPIHLLTMPPDDFELMELYREAGVTTIAFNLEVFDRAIFEEICPGKQQLYGYDRFLRALEYATRVLGEYRVFCGFIWGLEPKESTLSGYRYCLERGIAISSNVFHADQGSVFAGRAHPQEDLILALCEEQTSLHQMYPAATSIFSVSMRSTLDYEIVRGDFR
jgi:hypothetical protein